MGNGRMCVTMGEWLRSHRKPLLVHSLILSGFLLFCIFLSGPLFDRFEVIDGESRSQNVSLPAETDNILHYIDGVEGGIHITEVRGWAFVVGKGSENDQVHVVLKSDRKCYVFDAKSWPYAYNDLNIDYHPSGFLCNIPMRKISTGEYIIGIFIEEGDIQGLQYTDSLLVKS